MRKGKPKPRRWRCQGIKTGKQCSNRALFENGTKAIGDAIWRVPIKVKLCMECDKNYTHICRGWIAIGT